MGQKDKPFYWFFVSFVPCFGGYVALHFASSDPEYGIVEFLNALVAIPVLLIAWGISRAAGNRPLAQGVHMELGRYLHIPVYLRWLRCAGFAVMARCELTQSWIGVV